MSATIAAPVAAPVEVVTPIGPREALRLGRLIAPKKCVGDWFQPDGSACALGAMALGWGGTPDDPDVVINGLQNLGLLYGQIADIGIAFDDAEDKGEDGDAAALAKLAEYGL